MPAHIYRVGVTNAADRGLDMWANFGVAIQVKHMTLNEELASEIVDQVESDQLVIVCRDAEAAVISTIMKQISYGRRVRGIVKESDLIRWYELCLRGEFADRLAQPLLQRLADGFSMEFPQATYTTSFCAARGYTNLTPPTRWRTTLDA